MKKVVSKLPDLHLRQLVFIYSAHGPFTNNRQRTQKFGEKGNLKYIYQNELDKACFAHDAAYSDRKDLAKITISGNFLNERTYQIALNPQYDRYLRRLASMVYRFFEKKAESGVCVKEELTQ